MGTQKNYEIYVKPTQGLVLTVHVRIEATKKFSTSDLDEAITQARLSHKGNPNSHYLVIDNGGYGKPKTVVFDTEGVLA